MPHATPSDAVHEFVQARRDDLARYLADLVRARTVNPPGDEYLAAPVVTDFCDGRGIPYETFEKEKGRTNVVARIGSGRPRLLVPCHLDVVPAGSGWETDPFEPVIRDGRLYGRGAKDNKGALAGMMVAAEYLKEHEADLAGQLVLVACADEEAGSRLGMKYLLQECGVEAEMAIVPDAGSEMREIDVGEKGALFVKVRTVGRQAHGSTPEKGASAIWPTIAFLERIRHWRPVVPEGAEGAGLFTPPTLNVGTIHAGTVANIVPGECEAQIDMRFPPGPDPEAVLAHLRGELEAVAAAHEGVRMDLEVLSNQPPTVVDASNPMVEAVRRHTRAVTGAAAEPIGQSGATVAKFLNFRGIPAIGFQSGPEDVEHVAGEWNDLAGLADFAEVMTRVALDLLGG